jgi:nucleoid DNA-binding protein
MTQRQLMQAVAEALTKKGWDTMPVRDIEEVFDTASEILAAELKKKANEGKSIPVRGLGRFTLKRTPAKKSHKGRNPFTGEENYTFKAKPAGKKIRATPDKKLRDLAGA